MRPKLEDPLIKNLSTLGPGQYETVGDLNKNGRYYVSKYSNSGCGIVGKSQRKPIN